MPVQRGPMFLLMFKGEAMSRGVLLSTVFTVGLLVGVPARGDLPVFSGPQPSESLGPFKVVGAYGKDREKELDPIALADGKPTLLVFVHQFNRPAADLARVLMHYGQMRRPEQLFCAEVLLDDDLTKTEQYLKTAEAWWNLGTFLGVSLDGAEGPGSYGLNRNVQLTVIIANKNKVVANFPLVQPSISDAPKIIGELVKIVGGEIPTAQELEFIEAPPNLIPGPPHERENGKGTNDPELRELICKLLRSTGNEQAVRECSQNIDDYVASNEKRQYELGQASKLIVGLRYGSRPPVIERVPDQRDIFKAWAEKYGRDER